MCARRSAIAAPRRGGASVATIGVRWISRVRGPMTARCEVRVLASAPNSPESRPHSSWHRRRWNSGRPRSYPMLVRGTSVQTPALGPLNSLSSGLSHSISIARRSSQRSHIRIAILRIADLRSQIAEAGWRGERGARPEGAMDSECERPDDSELRGPSAGVRR